MKNIYDDPVFFKAYENFPRSVHGLTAAGEWHALKEMLPPLAGKNVLDLGCGFGWHCKYAADEGAKYVLGTDISKKMLAVAREKNPSPVTEYKPVSIEDLRLEDNSFQVVISSLAIHYIADFSSLCHSIYKWLTPKGAFVFSVEHPIFTAYGTQDWHYNEAGEKLHWPVDNYSEQGPREPIFLGEKVVKYHRTLTSYIQPLLDAGFHLTHIKEPLPSKELLDSLPEIQEEARRPMMLLLSAEK